MRLILFAMVHAFTLSACAGASAPIAVVTDKGVILHGTVTGSILNARFEVSNGKLTCAGIYPYYEAKVVTVTLRCSDGHSGIALVSRRSVFDGGGTVRFSDGSEGSFVFGAGAPKFRSRHAPVASAGVASSAVPR